MIEQRTTAGRKVQNNKAMIEHHTTAERKVRKVTTQHNHVLSSVASK